MKTEIQLKSLILYSAHSKLTRRHHRLPYTDIFVRCEKFDGNISDALNAAKPLTGETVLNSIPAQLCLGEWPE